MVEPQSKGLRKTLNTSNTYFFPIGKNNKAPSLPDIFFVTDAKRTPNPITIAKTLSPGTGILYRHFGQEKRFDEGLSLKKIAKERKLTLIISHDPKLSELIQPDGEHWPKHMLSGFKHSKANMRFITSSAHTFSQIRKAENLGLNACFVSSIFPSQSPSAPKPMGSLRFRILAKNSKIKLFALGGVTHKNSDRIPDGSGIAAVGGWN